jgi:hypothetical protein
MWDTGDLLPERREEYGAGCGIQAGDLRLEE